MREYRIYQLSPNSQSAWLTAVFNCENDEAATHYARHNSEPGADIEVWVSRRLVARIKSS